MPLLPAAPAALQVPLPAPAGVLAPLDPPTDGSPSYNYTSGTADGPALSYPQVSSFAWYIPLLDWRLVQPNRIRSSYTATLGRTLVGTPQADISVQETVPRGALAIGDRVTYPTVIRPTRPIATLLAIEDAGGLPMYEQTVTYESALAVLSRLYPESLYVTAQEAIGEDTMTAQQVMQYLFDTWSAQFPEFVARPVPPLVLFVEDTSTDDDGIITPLGTYTQTLVTDRIALRQPERSRRSIAQLLEDLREAFPGYALSVDSEGYVILLPPPWAAGADRRVVAPFAYRAGPGAWTLPLDSIGAVGRANVTSSDWLLDTDYDGTQVEVAVGVRMILSNSPTGPEETSLQNVYANTRGNATVVLDANTPQLLEHQVISTLQGGVTTLATAVYRLTWDRPDPTGGRVVVEVISAPTQAGTGLFFGSIEIQLFLSHALLLTAYSVGALGVRSQNVAGRDVQVPLPQASLDGSRVINAQTVRHEDVDFVDGDDLLARTAVRWGPTDYVPSGSGIVPLGQFLPFVDGDGEPLITGGEVTIDWLYELRVNSSAGATTDGGCAESGLFGGGDCVTRSGSFTLSPGQSRTVDIVLSGEWALTSGRVLTIRWRYRQLADGGQGLVVTFENISARTTNAAAARPWMAHVVSWDTSGSVWRETGVTLEATYDENSDADAALSRALYGRREGPLIEVNFFGVTIEQLQQMAQAIVRYNVAPRARWANIGLTAASDLTPDDLNTTLLMPWGIGALFEAYRYRDARALTGVLATRDIDLMTLYDLQSDISGPAGDVEEAVTGYAGVAAASYVLDADS